MINFSQSKTFKYLFTYLMDEVLQDFLNFIPFYVFAAQDMKNTSSINMKPQSEKYLQLTKIQAC